MKHATRIASVALALLLAVSACVTSGVTANAATASQTALMQKWVDEGLLTGYENGELYPDNTVTRAEFVHLMVKLGFTGTVTASQTGYTDVETNAWYYSDIMQASAAGYVSGRANGSFGPRDTITRQEGIAMVVRALGLGLDYTTGGGENCSVWFSGEVGAAIGASLYSSGTDFTADLSRAETVALLEAIRDKVPGSTTANSSGLAGVSGTGLAIDTISSVEDKTISKKSETVSGTVQDLTLASGLGSNSYTLDDVTVKGNLTIESTGTITLDDVTVEGKIIVEGSGAQVVLKKSAEVSEVVFHDTGSVSGSSYAGKLTLVTVDTDAANDAVGISVKAASVVAEDDCDLYITSAVDEVELNGAVNLYGSGSIGKLYINASGCTISNCLDIDKTTKASGVKNTSYNYRYDDDYCNYWFYNDWCSSHKCYYQDCYNLHDWWGLYGCYYNEWCSVHKDYYDDCYWQHDWYNCNSPYCLNDLHATDYKPDYKPDSKPDGNGTQPVTPGQQPVDPGMQPAIQPGDYSISLVNTKTTSLSGYAPTAVEVNWTSSNPNVATVDSKGNVTAVSNGTTVITAKWGNGLSTTISVTVKQTCTVTVTGDDHVKSATYTVDYGKDLTVTITPDTGYTIQSVSGVAETFTSNNGTRTYKLTNVTKNINISVTTVAVSDSSTSGSDTTANTTPNTDPGAKGDAPAPSTDSNPDSDMSNTSKEEA